MNAKTNLSTSKSPPQNDSPGRRSHGPLTSFHETKGDEHSPRRSSKNKTWSKLVKSRTRPPCTDKIAIT